MFPPISDEEIVERISKLRNKAAAGPVVFQKKHLQISGLLIVLAKLFNILIYTQGFQKHGMRTERLSFRKLGKI
jgi:hypothetical protein